MAGKSGRSRAKAKAKPKELSLLAEFKEIRGTISYPSRVAATLREQNGQTSLLVLDQPPFGLYDAGDIAAAAGLYRDFLRVPDGHPIKLVGIRASLNGQPIIKIIRGGDVDRLFGGNV